MTKTRILTTISLLLFLAASTSANITLTIEPAAQSVPLGNTVDVAVNISGLPEMAAPSLGAYDLDVTFDPSILSFNNVAFGDQLDLSILGSVPGYDAAVTGVVNTFEVSLESISNLNTLQAGSFNLFTLTFDTLALGLSDVDISNIVLGDAYGSPLSADVGGGGHVMVIPAPAALILSGLGLGLASRLRRRRIL